MDFIKYKNLYLLAALSVFACGKGYSSSPFSFYEDEMTTFGFCSAYPWSTDEIGKTWFDEREELDEIDKDKYFPPSMGIAVGSHYQNVNAFIGWLKFSEWCIGQRTAMFRNAKYEPDESDYLYNRDTVKTGSYLGYTKMWGLALMSGGPNFSMLYLYPGIQLYLGYTVALNHYTNQIDISTYWYEDTVDHTTTLTSSEIDEYTLGTSFAFGYGYQIKDPKLILNYRVVYHLGFEFKESAVESENSVTFSLSVGTRGK